MNLISKINIDIIPDGLTFIVGKKTFHSYCDKNYRLDFENYELTTHAKVMWIDESNGYELFLVIQKMPNHSILERKALIVHEISHVVDQIMEKYGFKCNEFKAYLSQYLYTELINVYDAYLKTGLIK